MIFHIAERGHWEGAQDAGSYRRSTLGRSLEEEGFIHCADESFPHVYGPLNLDAVVEVRPFTA